MNCLFRCVIVSLLKGISLRWLVSPQCFRQNALNRIPFVLFTAFSQNVSKSWSVCPSVRLTFADLSVSTFENASSTSRFNSRQIYAKPNSRFIRRFSLFFDVYFAMTSCLENGQEKRYQQHKHDFYAGAESK